MKEKILLEIASLVFDKEEKEEALYDILKKLISYIEADAGFIYLAKDGDGLIKVAQDGIIEFPRQIRKGEGTIGELAKGFPFLFLEDELLDWKSAISVPLRDKRGECGLLGLVREKEVFTENELSDLAIFSVQISLGLEMFRLRESLDGVLFSTVKALVGVMEAIDPNLRGHSWNVARLSVALAMRLSLKRTEREAIKYAALLHGIGRVGVPDRIWKKECILSAEEWGVVETHSLICEKIVKEAGLPFEVAPIIRSHHERWDGQGYPDKLKGEEIPLGARIIVIANAWDAMVSKRSFRKAKTIDEAKEEMQKGKGVQFDPNLVDTFFSMIEK
ncbi:MAG: HD domain-containing phosphohydrolase, partial [Candidatus Desantisbacteria bacterium]